jgi:hypothetical protein
MDATKQNEMDRRVGRIVRLAGEAGIELPAPLPRERAAAHDASLASYDRPWTYDEIIAREA